VVDGYAARLASEVVADVVAALLLGSVALLVSQLIRRRRIRTFFGITPGRETIKLFLSCIDVKPSGAIGTEKVTGGSQGTAINHLEYRYALDFAAAVESRPLVRVLHSIDPSDWRTAQPVNCRIEVGPSCTSYLNRGSEVMLDEVRQVVHGSECVVLVGGAIYNVVTKCILEADAQVQFIRDDSRGSLPRRGIKVTMGTSNPHEFYREDPVADAALGLKEGREYFIIRRFVWEQVTVFMCAGTCTAGTVAALRMLTSWRTLQRDLGSTPFLRVYEMPLETVTARETDPPPQQKIQRVLAEPPST
jgi:hypothetical protein